MVELEHARQMLHDLGLTTAAELLDAHLEQAVHGEMTYIRFLEELLSDNVLATALLDRLLHHAHILNIRGQTYRLKDRLKTGVHTVPPAQIPADG